MGIAAYFRLARAGYVLAREGAFSVIDPVALPPALRTAIGFARLFERRAVKRTGRVERLNRALNRLGPTYVKFGQTLATRPDIVGPEIAADLSSLQDAMEPFDAALVPGILKDALKDHAADLLDLSPPIAAASIAQVHRATLRRRRRHRAACRGESPTPRLSSAASPATIGYYARRPPRPERLVPKDPPPAPN